jgi:hypothetical protein
MYKKNSFNVEMNEGPVGQKFSVALACCYFFPDLSGAIWTGARSPRGSTREGEHESVLEKN